jgi:hypothetical protein
MRKTLEEGGRSRFHKGILFKSFAQLSTHVTRTTTLGSLVSIPRGAETIQVGGHTDTRNCCTITRTGSGLVDDRVQ